MKIRVAKTIVVVSAVLALGLMVPGCSFDSAEEVEAVTDESDEKSEAGAEGTPTGENADWTTDIGTAGIDAVQSDTVQGGTDNGESQENSEGRWHVFSPEVAEVVDADFEGIVWKIDDDSFYIAEALVEILEDGSITGSSPSSSAVIPDSDLIQVIFDENTHFYVRTIYDNGARYEDNEAGFQSLEKGASVEMKGEFINDVFYADEIRISRNS